MSDQLLQEMNDKHFVAVVQGKTVVGTEKDAHAKAIPVFFSSFLHFRERYSNQLIKVKSGQTEDGKPKYKLVPLGKWWLDQPGRRQYDRVGYWPRGEKAPPRAYNLWRGFTVTPKEGDWGIFQEHIWKNICRRDDGLAKYVTEWMAFAVQKPAVPPGVALVMRGTKGSGKSVTANALGHLFGPHYKAVSNSEQVTGRFNAHLQDLSLMLIDEGFWAGDKRAEGTLKQLITEPYLPIERKFYDLEMAPNRLHVMMASNEGHVVPARGLERRFLLLDLDDAQAQDTVFFGAMDEQLRHGGYEAMLYDLLNMDLSGFDVRSAPRTQGLVEQMLHSLTPFEEWWYGKLKAEQLLPTKKAWGRVVIKQLYDDYVEHIRDKRPLPESRFALELEKWVPGKLRRSRPGSGSGHRPWMYEFPPLDECKAEWERQHGVSMGWGETGEKEQSDDSTGA